MARRKRPKVGECVHCGTRGPITRDHIPPANLFPKPRPSGLVTVPSCVSCNGERSGDDEYFRLALTSRADVDHLPEVQRLTPLVLKGMSRPQARGFLESIYRSLGAVDLVTPAGLYLGTAPSINVDLRRLNRVVQRVTTGLFYRLFGERLPDAYTAVAYAVDGLNNLAQENREQLRRMCEAVQAAPGWSIGGVVFSFWLHPAEGDRYLTLWVFLFFKKVAFLGMTGRKDLIAQARRAAPAPASPLTLGLS